MTLRLSDREDRWRSNVRECREQKQLKAVTWLRKWNEDENLFECLMRDIALYNPLQKIIGPTC